jgi:hypothetical protein
MRRWIWAIALLVGVGGLGHYLAKYDPLNPIMALPPDKIVEQGQQLDAKWAESNQPRKKDYVLVSKIDIERTRAALEKVAAESPEYPKARALLESFKRREHDSEAAAKAVFAKFVEDDVDGRKQFVRETTTNFLKAGMDVTLTTTGAKATTLTFRYVLVSRPFLYKLMNDTQFIENCKSVGFTSIYFTDGHDASATYNVVKNRFN